MFVDIKDNHSVVDRVKLSYLYDDIDNFEVSYLPYHKTFTFMFSVFWVSLSSKSWILELENIYK